MSVERDTLRQAIWYAMSGDMKDKVDEFIASLPHPLLRSLEEITKREIYGELPLPGVPRGIQTELQHRLKVFERRQRGEIEPIPPPPWPPWDQMTIPVPPATRDDLPDWACELARLHTTITENKLMPKRHRKHSKADMKPSKDFIAQMREEYTLEVAEVRCCSCGNLQGDVYLAISRKNPEEFYKFGCIDRIKNVYVSAGPGAVTCKDCDMPKGASSRIGPLHMAKWDDEWIAMRINDAIKGADGTDITKMPSMEGGGSYDLSGRYQALIDPVSSVSSGDVPVVMRMLRAMAQDKSATSAVTRAVAEAVAMAAEELLVIQARVNRTGALLREHTKAMEWPEDQQMESFCDKLEETLQSSFPLDTLTSVLLGAMESRIRDDWCDARKAMWTKWVETAEHAISSGGDFDATAIVEGYEAFLKEKE